MQSLLYPIFLGLGLLATAKLRAADDILIADFEGTNYGNWKVTGEAFGPGPARGTLPGQMHVDGFKGKGLVNSFFQGDGTTGTLTSPAFTIQRNQLSFLIGGGDHKHETCIHLIIDGRILRTETGQNSEKLEPVCWDVPEYSGKQATLQIVDQCQGGWGHICVDQSVQTDKERGSFAQPDGQKPLGAQPEWEMGPFVKHATPVLSPTPDSKFQCPILGKDVRWEERNVYNPAAVVRDGKIYLLYRADDKNPRLKWGRTCRIGMAWSEDGIRFTRHPEPVLYPDNDQWKRYEWEGGCEDLHIVEGEDGAYYMNYTTWSGARDTVSVASSRDLVHWTKHGPAFQKAGKTGGRSGVVVARLVGDRLIAAKINGKYWMYFTHPCALAWSQNLIDWTPTGKAVWPQGGGGREAGAIALLRDDGILLLTQGGHPSLGAWTLRQALIDRHDLTTVLKEQKEPFLYPEYDWEKKGFTGNTTVANTLLPFKGKWLLYYGGADTVIGLATCPIAK